MVVYESKSRAYADDILHRRSGDDVDVGLLVDEREGSAPANRHAFFVELTNVLSKPGRERISSPPVEPGHIALDEERSRGLAGHSSTVRIAAACRVLENPTRRYSLPISRVPSATRRASSVRERTPSFRSRAYARELVHGALPPTVGAELLEDRFRRLELVGGLPPCDTGRAVGKVAPVCLGRCSRPALPSARQKKR